MREIMKADGFDHCIEGVCSKSGRIIYSAQKMIDTLAKDMPYEDAVEYFNFNIECAYVGEGTPIYMYDYDDN